MSFDIVIKMEWKIELFLVGGLIYFSLHFLIISDEKRSSAHFLYKKSCLLYERVSIRSVHRENNLFSKLRWIYQKGKNYKFVY